MKRNLTRLLRLTLCLVLALCLPLVALAENGYRGDVVIDINGETLTLSASQTDDALVAAFAMDSRGENLGRMSMWLEGEETLHLQYGKLQTTLSLEELSAMSQEDAAVTAYLNQGLLLDLMSLVAMGDGFAELLATAFHYQPTATGWSLAFDAESLADLGRFFAAAQQNEAWIATLARLNAWDAFSPDTAKGDRAALVTEALASLSSVCASAV